MPQPTSIPQLLEYVPEEGRVFPVGAGTKPALTASVPGDFTRVDMTGLRGIVEYDPSEFTITALAGTPVAEIENALAENGQYLPFDPPLAASGATIGGTVASGMSGPGAYRFGPVRDFLIGVKFVDGRGTLITGGGKVVKNAAGFDLPKFLIGSCGRFGILAEVTFKVFPLPEASLTSAVETGPEEAVSLIGSLSRGSLDLDALEYDPAEGRIVCRIRGNAGALPARKKKIAEVIGREGMEWDEGAADSFWAQRLSFGWADREKTLAKFPIVPGRIPEVETLLRKTDGRGIFGMGGNVLYLGCDLELIKAVAEKLGRGVILRSPQEMASPWIGATAAMEGSLQKALDPEGRFPPVR